MSDSTTSPSATTSPKLDPFGRRESWLRPPQDGHDSQTKRRQRALDAQKQRRVHAIEAARSSFRELEFMEDLSLAGSPESSDTEHGEALPPSSTAGGDAASNPPPVIGKTKRQRFKPKFHAWAKNLLSHAETLDLRHGLPEGLESDWRAVVVPKGKRCLCATMPTNAGVNTILYSRVAGRTLGRFRTSLPPDCLLDTVWDAELGVLWVLDLCAWRSTWFVECEADMRAFFLASKLSELDTQAYFPPSSPFATQSQAGTIKTLLVLPVPSVAPPLLPSTLLPLLDPLAAAPNPAPQALPVAVLAPYATPEGHLALAPAEVPIPLAPTGVLLYLSSAHYESGSTPLVSWVPCGAEVAAEDKDREGVERMRTLVSEWAQRGGGPAAVAGLGEGQQSHGMVDGSGAA
ncbi:uncharacterized protein RHOBADRAFT_56592 [Rhodotorula graminis WP1]|uniref:Snurportin-1 n=1 Tax=Rhodotorula graminis (strain WP1) TaxID=578459 RepID=A0A0P9GFF6_RHOGW|nr:uncharacterized protein RHOBADRAFT_56592 [Rhodotorula graminis WP1]KPV71556.1 hypothetical protein RHOBADRAFT_56592 [Rhodotorula graminis WP1]